jgi:hypothetical protein
VLIRRLGGLFKEKKIITTKTVLRRNSHLLIDELEVKNIKWLFEKINIVVGILLSLTNERLVFCQVGSSSTSPDSYCKKLY